MAPAPQDPANYFGLICQYEAELDVITPFWRNPPPWPELDMPRQRRMKWLLKRRMLLSQGVDLPVQIVDGVANKAKCWAHPVTTEGSTCAPPPEVGAYQVAVPTPGPVSVSSLAFSLRVPLERVEEARAFYLSQRPPCAFDAAWVASWLSGGAR